MQYSQEHLKTMAYAEFGGQTECIMANWKIENEPSVFQGSTWCKTAQDVPSHCLLLYISTTVTEQ